MSKLGLPTRVSPRHFAAVVVLVFLVQPLGSPGFGVQEASATEETSSPSPKFGLPGEPTWDIYPSPGDDRGGEAMLGMDRDLEDRPESAFLQGGRKTYRADFNDDTRPPAVTWTNITQPVFDPEVAWDAWESSMHNPLLDTDHNTSNTIAGTQVVRNPCTFLSYTDDRGQTWNPGAPGCALPAIDHPTIAMGPWPPTAEGTTYPHATYLCGWEPSLSTHCYMSGNGGQAWTYIGPVLPTAMQCSQQSGRLHVGPDGTMLLPFADCGGKATVFRSQDGGSTWSTHAVAGSAGDEIAFPPDVALSNGRWMYVGASQADGAYVAVFDDQDTQLDLADGQQWLKVSGPEFYTGPFGETIEQTEFAGIVAGDHDRAAFAFYGAYEPSPGKNACQMGLVWYLFVAMTYDAGQTWSVQLATPGDAVQGGGIGVFDPLATSEDCRNLADSALEVEMGGHGRVHVAFSDGCTEECRLNPSSSAARGAFDGLHTIVRQTTGKGLLADYDIKENAVELFQGPCGNTMDPNVRIEAPRHKEVITDVQFDIAGNVDRNPILTELEANATSTPLEVAAGFELPLIGKGRCGYGALPDGSMHPDLYTCTWTPLEGDPVIEPSATVCGSRSSDDPAFVRPTITYPEEGRYNLSLEVRDTAGQVDVDVIEITVGPFEPDLPLTGCHDVRPGRPIVTEDKGDKNPVVMSDGTNELTCVGAYYDHVHRELELQIGNKGGDIYPNHAGTDSDPTTAQRYWIHLTPNFGPQRGREQVVEVFQGHENPNGNRPDPDDPDDWEAHDPWVLACLLLVPEARQIAGYRPTLTPERDDDSGGAGDHCDPGAAGAGSVEAVATPLTAAVDEIDGTVTSVYLPLEQLFGPVVPGARFDDVWVEAWHVPGANAEDECGAPEPPGASADVWRWEGVAAGPACIGAGVGVDLPAGTPPSVEPPKVDVDASSMMPVIDDISADCKTSDGNQTPHPVSILLLTYDFSTQTQPCYGYEPSSGDPVPLAPSTSGAGVCDPSFGKGYNNQKAPGTPVPPQTWEPFTMYIVEVCIPRAAETEETFDIVVNYRDKMRTPSWAVSPMTMVMANVCDILGGHPAPGAPYVGRCNFYGIGWDYEWTAGGCLRGRKSPAGPSVCYLFVYKEQLDPTADGKTPVFVAGGVRMTHQTRVVSFPNSPYGGGGLTYYCSFAEADDPLLLAYMFDRSLTFHISKKDLDIKVSPRPVAGFGCVPANNVNQFNTPDGGITNDVEGDERWYCLQAATSTFFMAEVTGIQFTINGLGVRHLDRTGPGCQPESKSYPFPGFASCKASFKNITDAFVGQRVDLVGSLSGCSSGTTCLFSPDGSQVDEKYLDACPKHDGLPENAPKPPQPYIVFDECGEYDITWEVTDPIWVVQQGTLTLERTIKVSGEECIEEPPDEYVLVKWDGVEIEDGNLSQNSAITMRDVWSTAHDLSDEIEDKGGVLEVNGEHTIRAEWYIELEGELFLVDVHEIVVDVHLTPPVQSKGVGADKAVEDGREESRMDSDRDGIIDASDNCPRTPNTGQEDLDTDAMGDACDSDIDGDGWFNHVDNCPRDVDPDRIDSDSDGKGDLCDEDDDNDGIKDGVDNCPLVANKAQVDGDGDGLGDACDGDRDGDGSLDHFDAFPDDPLQWADRDGDGFGDNPGKNGDNCPTIRNPDQLDSDSNGVGDACEGLVEASASGQSWSIPGELAPLDAAGVEAPESKGPFQGLSIAVVLAVIGLALIGLLVVRTLRRE